MRVRMMEIMKYVCKKELNTHQNAMESRQT
jgi:hypothetical protein